jgi:hypothetical protein
MFPASIGEGGSGLGSAAANMWEQAGSPAGDACSCPANGWIPVQPRTTPPVALLDVKLLRLGTRKKRRAGKRVPRSWVKKAREDRAAYLPIQGR